MKTFIVSLFLIVVAFQFPQAEESRGRRGQSRAAPASRQRVEFPKYNRPSAVRIGERPVRAVPVYHDALGNHVTVDHMSRVDFAHGRTDTVMKNDVHVTDIVHVGRNHYVNNFRPVFETKRPMFTNFVLGYNTFVATNPMIVGMWHRHFFYSGCYYGFHPILDIDTYFYNPTVYWFYVGTFDEPYYRHWYQNYYEAYPEFHSAFEFHGVYYPTDNLKQLLFGVSAMPADKQAKFRTAISQFTQLLAQNLANNLHQRVVLTKGDIAVTHYEIVGYDDAIVLDGLVTHNNAPYNFKGLLDLQNPNQSAAFVPASFDKNPSAQQLEQLDQLNAKIDAIRGGPPLSAEPAEPPPAPPAGQVIAEPQK